MRKLIFIFLVFVLAACSSGSQSEVERNREKWQDAGISHYRYHLFVGCFCVFNQDMPLVIEVQDGEVVSMEYQSGNEIDAASRESFEKYATIDRIFDGIERDFQDPAGTDDSESRKADEVVVNYDATYGFPTQVDIDFIKDAIDDELSLSISNFEELP